MAQPVLRTARLTLTNCTVSGNSAAGNGGGMYNDDWHHGHPRQHDRGREHGRTSGPDAFGTFTSQGNNLIGETDGSSGWVGSDLTGTSTPPLNPLLAPLGNYGGPTQTMALLPGSPAIGAGIAVAGLITDQRGQPADLPSPDIGAYQKSPTPFIVATAGGQFEGWLGGACRTRPSASMSSPAPPTTPTGPARNRTSSAR